MRDATFRRGIPPRVGTHLEVVVSPRGHVLSAAGPVDRASPKRTRAGDASGIDVGALAANPAAGTEP